MQYLTNALDIRTIFHELTLRTGVPWTKLWEMLFCSFSNLLKYFQAEDAVYN